MRADAFRTIRVDRQHAALAPPNVPWGYLPIVPCALYVKICVSPFLWRHSSDVGNGGIAEAPAKLWRVNVCYACRKKSAGFEGFEIEGDGPTLPGVSHGGLLWCET